MAVPKNDYRIVGWRAWYTGGRTFDSTTTRWPDLPTEGALVFVLYSRTRPYRRVMVGVSLYWHDPVSQVYGCDNAADAIIPDKLRDGGWVKRGKWVADAEFRPVVDEAMDAKDAPDESLRVDKQRA